MPRADEMPPLEVVHLDFPSAINPLGIKGVGESGVIPVAAAVANAVGGRARRLRRGGGSPAGHLIADLRSPAGHRTLAGSAAVSLLIPAVEAPVARN